MNIHSYKNLNAFKGVLSFDALKATVINLKKSLSLMGIVLLLVGCAVFTGRETAGEYTDDAAITASVKNEIFQDPQLKMFQIHVETFKNQVQLSGFVDSQREIARAGQIARKVEGVQGVNNNLVVRKRTPRHR